MDGDADCRAGERVGRARAAGTKIVGRRQLEVGASIEAGTTTNRGSLSSLRARRMEGDGGARVEG